MNENTLVSVHGYAGDAHQVRNLLPCYLHHRCPVAILSPVDSQIGPHELRHRQGLIFRHAGQRAYIGDLSLERQKQQMKVLLQFPQRWFLMNDSDSFCLSPEIPVECYQQADVFWSNEVSDMMHKRPDDWPYPRLAFQPPYFCSRAVLEAMVKATESVTFESIVDMKFIDHYLMRLAHAGGIKHQGFPVGISCPTANYPPGQEHMLHQISRGGIMLHSIKTPDVIALAVGGRKKYLRAQPRGRNFGR